MDKIQNNSKYPNKEIIKINKQNNDNNKINSINIDDSNNLNSSEKLTDLISTEVVNGELRKLKTNGLKLFSNTNIRWVELNFKKKIFGYKIKKADPNFKEYQNLNDLLDFKSEISHEDKNKSKWKHGFYLMFKNRSYTFYGENENEFIKWNNTLTRVYNIFVKFKDISLKVFKIALETFATPYYDELERERLRRLEEERKKKKELPKPKPQKINYTEMLGIKLINDGQKISDIYSEDIKKNFEEEIDNMEVNRKLQILNNFENEIMNKNNYKKGKVECNDDLNDWDFYNQENQKIEEKNLINYNPVLKEQRKNIGSIMNSIVKGYIVEGHRFIENLNLKTQTKRECSQEIKNSDNHLNNLTNNNVKIVLEFANKEINDSGNELKDSSEINYKKSNPFTNHENEHSNKKLNFKYPEEHKFVELKHMPFDQEKKFEKSKQKTNKYKGDSIFKINDKDPKNKVKNISYNNHPQDIFIRENIFPKKTEKKSEMNLNNTFLNENKNTSNKIKEIDNNLVNSQAIVGDVNDFKYTKFLITKEQLLKEINAKNHNQIINSNSMLVQNDDFYNFDFENSNQIFDEKKNKNKIHESFDENKQKELNKTPFNKNNHLIYEKINCNNVSILHNDSITKNNKDENSINPIQKNDESPNKTVIKITKNKLGNFNEKNNSELDKSKQISLLNKYIRQRAIEYLNVNRNIDIKPKEIYNNTKNNNYINVVELDNKNNINKDRNSKSANKATDTISDVSKNLLINKKQNLIDLIYGKKSKL